MPLDEGTADIVREDNLDRILFAGRFDDSLSIRWNSGGERVERRSEETCKSDWRKERVKKLRIIASRFVLYENI